jgi:hypothetical protein
LSTVPQHQWISKLFDFNFDVEYRPGCLNTVAYVLSHRDEAAVVLAEGTVSEGAVHALSVPSFTFLDEVRQATSAAPDAQRLVQRLHAGELQAPWRMDGGLLLHGSRIFILDYGDLHHQELLLAHSAGHEGV